MRQAGAQAERRDASSSISPGECSGDGSSSGRRKDSGSNGDSAVLPAVMLLTAAAGVAVGLWRKLLGDKRALSKRETEVERLAAQLSAQNVKLEAVLSLLGRTREDLIGTRAELDEVQASLVDSHSALHLTRSQMQVLVGELGCTKRQLAQAKADLDARSYQVRSLQSGTEYDAEYVY